MGDKDRTSRDRMGLETSPPTLEGREGGTVPLNGWGGGGAGQKEEPRPFTAQTSFPSTGHGSADREGFRVDAGTPT